MAVKMPDQLSHAHGVLPAAVLVVGIIEESYGKGRTRGQEDLERFPE